MKLSSSTLVNTFAGTTNVDYNNYIENVSHLILSNSNRDGFIRGSYTKISSDKDIILLKVLPFISVSSITDLDNNNIIPSNAYKINYESGIIKMNYVGNFKIVYVAGYLVDFTNMTSQLVHDLPEELSNIVSQLSAALYNKSQALAVGAISTDNNILASESVEGQSVSYFNRSGGMSSKATDNVLAGIVLTDFQQSTLDNYNLNEYI